MKNADNPLEETLTFERLIYGGEALARSSTGAVVFVPGAIPEEQAQVNITQTKGSFWRGEIAELLKPSPHRVIPPCPYVPACGGCQWQHIDYSHQVEWKGKILEEQLWRADLLKGAGLELPLASPAPFNYRVRVQLKVKKTAKGYTLGYYGVKSHQVVDLEACLVAHPAINKAIKEIRQALEGMVLPRELFSLELTYGSADDAVLMALSWEGPLRPLKGVGEGLAARVSSLAGIVVFREAGGIIRQWERVSGQTWVRQRVGDYTFRQSFGSFFQVNVSAWAQLLDLVVSETENPSWLAADLCCGVGFFTIPLAKVFQRVLALEINPLAQEDAEENCKKMKQKNIAVYRDTAENLRKYLNAGEEVDLIFLDPPRAGLSGRAVEELTKIGSKRLLYLSCNPSTLARDLQRLKAHGYTLDKVYPLDLFPQTYHLEALASMKYKG